jgi:hypothetical protein
MHRQNHPASATRYVCVNEWVVAVVAVAKMVVQAKHDCMKDHHVAVDHHVVGVAVDRAAMDCHVAVAHGTAAVVVAVVAVDATHFCKKTNEQLARRMGRREGRRQEDKRKGHSLIKNKYNIWLNRSNQ